MDDEQKDAYAKTWQAQIDVASEKFRALGRAILEALKLR